MFNKSLKCIVPWLLSGTQMQISFVCSNVSFGFRNHLAVTVISCNVFPNIVNRKISIFFHWTDGHTTDRQQTDKTNCLTLPRACTHG